MKISDSSLLVAIAVSTQQLVNAQTLGAACSLCIDGSTPPLLDNPVFDFDDTSDTTCADFAANAAGIAVIDEGSFLACRQLQDVGLSNCGCETPEELKTGCTLCPGGNELLPDPSKEVIPHVTCSGIAKVVERFEEEECRSYQQVIGGMCGCPDAPTTRSNGEDTCRICVDREVDLPANPVDLSEFGLDAVPCAFFETIANQDEETSCEVFQLSRETCCELPSAPPAPPSNLAELCSTDTISSDFEAYVACANTCIEASCCGSSCITNPTCFQYLPCVALETLEPPEPVTDDEDAGDSTSSGPPPPPSNLAELCEEDLIASDTGAFVACALACAPAECCLDACSESTTCFQYLPCANLDTEEQPGDGTTNPSETTVPVGNTTASPTPPPTPPPTAEGTKDSGANGDSGHIVYFRVALSILLTMTAVAIAEWGI